MSGLSDTIKPYTKPNYGCNCQWPKQDFYEKIVILTRKDR